MLVKSLEEYKCKLKSIPLLFEEDIASKRIKLLGKCEIILLEDFETIGKKTRDIIWRKGYYETITTAKKYWKTTNQDLSESEVIPLTNFIRTAIKHYKTLILKFEDMFGLDLRHTIDLSIIASGADTFPKKIEREIYTLNETSYALETIHSFLICLGDLHRYCIEFNFADTDVSIATSKHLAAKYYLEAFKLNPKNGMPHNQLGTLKAGENNEIDSIFHYLYSLMSPTPFELSENNVNRIFRTSLESLEKSAEEIQDNNNVKFNVKFFIMELILVIDIFFYDKEIEDFPNLCHSVFLKFKEYLVLEFQHKEADITFQLVSIFMVCLLKLKLNNSPKVQCMNAFLVAFTSEIVDISINRIDSYIADHKDENLKFCDIYNRKFINFDKKIKHARDVGREKHPEIEELNGKIQIMSIESKPTLEENEVSSNKSQKSDPQPVVIVKRVQAPPAPVVYNRRRRKRRGKSNSSDGSDNDSISRSFSDDSDSDNQSMNSDFESYDEGDDASERSSYYESSDNNSDVSDGEIEENDVTKVQKSDNEDVIVEDEQIIYTKINENVTKLTNGTQDFFKCQNGFQRIDTDEEEVHSQTKNGGGVSSNEDFVIEDEQIVFQNGYHSDVDERESGDDKMMRMKYKKRYTKVNPNIIIRFDQNHENIMRSLKILFDWLRLNQDILIGCYSSNPEFINKIMKLINILNIDIFTRKIYFDRSLIDIQNVRDDLRHLFDTRHQIATTEDVTFKRFLLFEEYQGTVNWELNYKLQITNEEDVILRNFKIVDFGFYLCKLKKFNHNFCARTRVFIEKHCRTRGGRRQRNRRDRNDGRNDCRNERDREQNRNGMQRGERRDRKRNRRRNRSRNRNRDSEQIDRVIIRKHSQDQQQQQPEIEEFPSIEQSQQPNYRKGYLKNKSLMIKESTEGKENQTTNFVAVKDTSDEDKLIDKKNELMGKLWLRNEVQNLESQMIKPANVALTPFLMLDSKSLTDYLYIVKNLVKTKKFVVLIPTSGE